MSTASPEDAPPSLSEQFTRAVQLILGQGGPNESESVAFRQLWLSPATPPESEAPEDERAPGPLGRAPLQLPIPLLAAPAAGSLATTELDLVKQLLVESAETLSERIAPWLNARAPNDTTGTALETESLRSEIANQMARRILGLACLVDLTQDHPSASDAIVERMRTAAHWLADEDDEDSDVHWPIDIQDISLQDDASEKAESSEGSGDTAKQWCYLWWSTCQSPQSGKPATISAAHWLELERLLRYLTRAESLEPIDSDRLMFDVASMPLLLVSPTAGKGHVERLEVCRWDATADGVCWDPVLRGIAAFDEGMRASLIAARYAVRKSAELASRSLGSFLAQCQLPGVERISGGSAGAPTAVALLACSQGHRISVHRYASAALTAPQLDAVPPVVWRDIPLETVNADTVLRKCEAARVDAQPTSAAVVFAAEQTARVGEIPQPWPIWRDLLPELHRSSTQDISTCETLGALYDQFTADNEAEQNIAAFATSIQQRWDAQPTRRGRGRGAWRSPRPMHYVPSRFALKRSIYDQSEQIDVATDVDSGEGVDAVGRDRSLTPIRDLLPKDRQRQLAEGELKALAAESDESDDQEQHDAWMQFELERESAEMAHLLELSTETRQLLIAEDAGAGKTVFSYRLQAWLSECNQDVQAHFSGPVLAIRFGMDDGGWPEMEGDGNGSDRLLAALTQRLETTTNCATDVCRRAVKLAASQGRLVIILDAFDQGTGREQRVLDLLNDVLNNEGWEDTWVVVTSRASAITHLERAPDKAMDESAWQIATLMLWDVNQQARYLDRPPRPDVSSVLAIRKRHEWEESDASRHREALTQLLPCYDERVERLLGVPLLMQLVYTIAYGAARPKKGPLKLESMRTRYAIFQKAWEEILSRDTASHSKELHRKWEQMLGAIAWVMAKNRLWNYRVPTDDLTVEDLKNEARQLVSFTDEWDTAWEAMEKFAPLADHNVIEPNHREASLSFRLRGWMEYFAGRYLATWSRDNDADVLVEKELGSDPECHWVWQFSLEAASVSLPHSPWLRALGALFVTPPIHQRRPTELMWRTLIHLKRIAPSVEQSLRDQLHQAFVDECLLSEDHERQTVAASLVPERVWKKHIPEDQWDSLQSQLINQAEATLKDEKNPVPQASRQLTEDERTADLHYAICPPTGDGGEPSALTFFLGSEEVDHLLPPRVEVRLPRQILMQRTAVTCAQFRLFDAAWMEQRSDFSRENSPDDWCPANGASYLDAFVFATWAGATLPDEAQWEFACRVGHDGPQDWYGITADPARTSYDEIDHSIANYKHSVGRTVRVRSYLPNDWGLYQMHGNVWEWCLDRWQSTEDLQQRLGGASPVDWTPCCMDDPLGVLVSFVLRGGSYYDVDPRDLRAAFRVYDRADERYVSYGFRLLYCIAGES